MSVTPLVDLLIAVFNNSAISGAITNCTHGVTQITPPGKFPKISTRAKRDSLVLIFWGISTGDVIYSTSPRCCIGGNSFFWPEYQTCHCRVSWGSAGAQYEKMDFSQREMRERGRSRSNTDSSEGLRSWCRRQRPFAMAGRKRFEQNPGRLPSARIGEGGARSRAKKSESFI